VSSLCRLVGGVVDVNRIAGAGGDRSVRPDGWGRCGRAWSGGRDRVGV